MPALCAMEHDAGTKDKDRAVIQVSDRVPGERVRLVVTGQRTDDSRTCTVVMIHEDSGTWAIHGLGNQGVRVSAVDMVVLGEAIVERAQ
jgi:hypothetical protein